MKKGIKIILIQHWLLLYSFARGMWDITPEKVRATCLP